MKTGYCGTFVISWAQTELDGFAAGPVQTLRVGASWSWQGKAVRVDGPTDVLRLERTGETERLHRRAAGMARRLVGGMGGQPVPLSAEDSCADAVMDRGFVLTDGRRTFTVTVIETGRESTPLLMFLDTLPPRNQELWVVKHSLDRQADSGAARKTGVICFTPGTRIATPRGDVPVEALREGDLVRTADNGAQPLRWIGGRRISGARLRVSPELRPVRINTGVLGSDMPDRALRVSPGHRIVLRGSAARDLFHESEVLVAARDLINDQSVVVERALPDVTYIHLMFDTHQLLWANGVMTESFHPAAARLGTVAPEDRARLLVAVPGVEADPFGYGAFARRRLSGSETAILAHAA